jgi:hypothetical protein
MSFSCCLCGHVVVVYLLSASVQICLDPFFNIEFLPLPSRVSSSMHTYTYMAGMFALLLHALDTLVWEWIFLVFARLTSYPFLWLPP